jgi:hypothetical protein
MCTVRVLRYLAPFNGLHFPFKSFSMVLFNFSGELRYVPSCRPTSELCDVCKNYSGSPLTTTIIHLIKGFYNYFVWRFKPQTCFVPQATRAKTWAEDLPTLHSVLVVFLELCCLTSNSTADVRHLRSSVLSTLSLFTYLLFI